MTDTESFGYLVHHGLAEELYRSGEQRFWIIDSGSSHRGEAVKEFAASDQFPYHARPYPGPQVIHLETLTRN
jgi:hypothetical protein